MSDIIRPLQEILANATPISMISSLGIDQLYLRNSDMAIDHAKKHMMHSLGRHLGEQLNTIRERFIRMNTPDDRYAIEFRAEIIPFSGEEFNNLCAAVRQIDRQLDLILMNELKF